MRCESIELVNFCNHKYKKEEFGDGLIAVIGANGTGKSNFLGAVNFAITGENPNVGTKADNAYWLAGDSDVSYVELVFSHGSVTATVRRNIRPTRPTATLVLSTGEILEGDRDVTARIEQLLGITTAVFNNVVVGRQKDIYGFIDETDAKRAEQFQRLFNTAPAAVLYKFLGGKINNIEIPSVSVDRDQLQIERAVAVTTQTTLDAQLQLLPGFPEIQENRDANVEVITASQARTQLQTQRDGYAVAVGNFETQIAADKADLVSVEQSLAVLTEQLGEGEADVAAARVAIGMLAQRQQQRTARQAAAKSLNDAQDALNNLSAPVLPTEYIPEGTETGMLSLQAEERQARTLVGSFKDGAANCPTCGTSTTTLQDAIAAANLRLPVLQREIQRIQQAAQASLAFDRRQVDYDNARALQQSQIAQLQVHLEAIPEQSEEVEDPRALQVLIDTDKERRDAVAVGRAQVQQLAANVSNLDGRLETTQQSIQDIDVRMAGVATYTAAQVSQADVNIHGWDTTAANRRHWETDLAAASETVRQIDARLADADTTEKQSAIMRSWRDFLIEVRGTVHKDASPRFVAQRNLERLACAINTQLCTFQAKYYLTASDGLSFDAHFSDGVVQPVTRLSGGQKVIVALAWRLSLNLLYAGSVGAIHLDEPTAYLDAEHIRSFEPVLEQLRELSSARGLQCIIVTHERDLAPMFDSVIQL